MAVISVNSEQFESEVLKEEKPVLVDFNADWCGPCQALKPIVEELSSSHPDVKFVSVNIDDEDELADDNDVASIPCLVLYKNGKEVNRSVGLISRDAIEELLESK